MSSKNRKKLVSIVAALLALLLIIPIVAEILTGLASV